MHARAHTITQNLVHLHPLGRPTSLWQHCHFTAEHSGAAARCQTSRTSSLTGSRTEHTDPPGRDSVVGTLRFGSYFIHGFMIRIGYSIGVENCHPTLSSSSPYFFRKLSRMPVPVRSLIQQDECERAEAVHFAADLLQAARRRTQSAAVLFCTQRSKLAQTRIRREPQPTLRGSYDASDSDDSSVPTGTKYG